ncbi:MAG: hypothetical protein ACRDTM_15970, partial [Micromonosporaceae bacterium]
VSAGAPHPAWVALARRLDATVVPVSPGDPLAEWLRRGHARAALLRPDRVVLATARRHGPGDGGAWIELLTART